MDLDAKGKERRETAHDEKKSCSFPNTQHVPYSSYHSNRNGERERLGREKDRPNHSLNIEFEQKRGILRPC